jgi:hypothetical protein
VRAPGLRIAVALLAASIGLGLAPARAEDPTPPPDVDAARASEKHAIEAGSESLFGEMLGKGEALPGGCKLTDGKIERTGVLATYTCGDAPVVLQLLHPEAAPAGGVRTERFAVNVQSGAAPAGLVDAVADRIRAREAKFTWTDVGDARARPPAGGTGWLLGLVVVVAAFLVYRSLRRRGTDAA